MGTASIHGGSREEYHISDYRYGRPLWVEQLCPAYHNADCSSEDMVQASLAILICGIIALKYPPDTPVYKKSNFKPGIKPLS